MNKVLTIAGSDCSGGAGIQADLKTIMAHKLYGMSVINALTAQNTLGVIDILDIPPEFVSKQIQAVMEDILPDAIKIGMVSNPEIIKIISGELINYNIKNIVVDPVMISTSGYKLLSDDAIKILKELLFPLASIITPNIAEAEVLSDIKINTSLDMILAAKNISKYYDGYILIKGGHLEDSADDLLYINNTSTWIKGERIINNNTHGTGCTLSSAIACNLAVGNDMLTSVINAKNYINDALKANLDLGRGSGPLDHCCNL
ncbi:MAG: bifunctional hydroxymethylpyrimidine kinase/phosphomethylpyrimidine kinase [Erysipelotrichaceae bacterium]